MSAEFIRTVLLTLSQDAFIPKLSATALTGNNVLPFIIMAGVSNFVETVFFIIIVSSTVKDTPIPDKYQNAVLVLSSQFTVASKLSRIALIGIIVLLLIICEGTSNSIGLPPTVTVNSSSAIAIGDMARSDVIVNSNNIFS